MKVIEDNPFRILGLPITASVREIEKRSTELETYASMGKPKTYDTDFNFKPVLRTLEAITEARKKLQLDEEKFRNSLFWFWNHNSVDELALDLLRDGNVDKAIAIWEKAVFSNKRDAYTHVSVVEDLISASSGFPKVDDDDHRLEIETDTYVIERKTSGTTAATAPADFDDSERWLIECDAEWMAGDDNCAFGLVWGRGKNSYFSFEISANGYYRIGRTIDWKFESIKEWTKADEIIDGYDLNHIQVERQVDGLIFRINESVVGTIPHEPFFGNRFGFKVYGEQTVHFTNLKLSKLKLDDRYASGVEITSKNVSCAKNLALLHLYRSAPHDILKSDLWERAISLFEKFVSSDCFGEYVKTVAGERFVPNWNETVDYYNRLLIEIQKPALDKTYGVTTRAFIKSFSVFPDRNFQAVKNCFVAGSIQKINKAVSKAEEQRRSDATKAVDTGKELISSVGDEISRLSTTLGTESIEYKLASDKVVDEVVQCSVDHSHAAFDPELELPLLKYAASIAVTPKSLDRVNKNLRTCEVALPEKLIFDLVKETRTKLSSFPQNGISLGEKLATNCKDHFLTLGKIAGSDSEEYKRAADAVSGTAVQCAIAYFNSTKNDEHGLPLYQYAVSIAASSEAKKYANENLASCKEWIKNKAYLLCHFCGKNVPKMANSITKTMYLETSRSSFPRRVSFSYGDVAIPRCEECESIHTRVHNYYLKTAFTIIGGAIVGFVIGAVLSSNLMPSGLPAADREQTSILIAAVCAFVTGLVGFGVTRKFFTKVDASDIRKASDIGSYPPIQKRLSEGWSFSKPSA